MEYQPKDLLPLLKTLSEKYTSKSSTSVSYETAQQLMGAILYCIGENRYDENGEAATLPDATAPIDAEASYERGYSLVVAKIKKAHTLYNCIMTGFDACGCHAYEETMVNGLPEFFKWYDPKFAPRNHIILLDYPVLHPMEDRNGIDLIYGYLQCVELEQLFLSRFPKKYIRNVLLQYHRDYSELLLNAAEIVLRNLLLNLLLETDVPVIKFSAADIDKLQGFVLHQDKELLIDTLYSELNFFIAGQFASNNALRNYLGRAVPDLAVELRNAAENNCMDIMLGGNLYG